jgi:UrcA family protein
MKTKCNMGKAALLIGAVLLSTGAVASVEGSVVIQSEAVKYSEAEATTEAGASALYASLRAAARRVCVVSFGKVTMAIDTETSKCVSEAVGHAVADVSIPAVTALYMKGKSSGKVDVMTVAGR